MATSDLYGKCPYVTSQKVISGKWNMLILHYIHISGPIRFGELLRMLPDLSQATLTKQLRWLENKMLISREVFAEVPPRVEYSLTNLGMEFLPVLEAYEEFGLKYIAFLRQNQ